MMKIQGLGKTGGKSKFIKMMSLSFLKICRVIRCSWCIVSRCHQIAGRRLDEVTSLPGRTKIADVNLTSCSLLSVMIDV